MSAAKHIEDLLIAIRPLPVPDRLRLIEHVAHDIASDDTSNARDPKSIIGSYADVADVVENITEAAMEAREREPLRLRAAMR